MKNEARPIICPHCGKPIRKAKKPRDLGLLLHALTYRVPVEQEITEAWIETARKHCKMKPERLKELRGEAFERFWRYMEDKRARRVAWLKDTGEIPPYGWTPPRPGEPDHTKAVQAMKVYRKSVAKLKAKQRRRPDAQSEKLMNRYLETKRIRSTSRKLEALNDVGARLVLQSKIESGEVTLEDYRTLKSAMLPDDRYSRRARKKGQ
jgi:uncharacterized protein YecA (UPF0149 family)